jgi:hypothetical protein
MGRCKNNLDHNRTERMRVAYTCSLSARGRFPLVLFLAALLLATMGCSKMPPGVVFLDDFDGGNRTAASVTAGWQGVVTLETVKGFSGAGFKGRFLHNKTTGNPAAATILRLSGLPRHQFVNIRFLLAIINTWDGDCGAAREEAGGAPNSTHCPDYFNVTVDGVQVFHETFFFESPVPQSYKEAERKTLRSRGVDFNKGGYDLVYDMGADPSFLNIPHSADTLTISFFASGAGWQGLDDESWAIDNIGIELGPLESQGFSRREGAEGPAPKGGTHD